MLRLLVVVVCGVAAFFLFYLLAMVQSKPRLEMEKRVGQLFDSNLETPTSRRSKGSKEKTHPRRLEQIAEELYVAGVALRAEEFITIWVVLGAVIPTFALFLGAPVSLCIGLAIVGASAPIGFVTLKRNKKLALLDKQLPDAMTVICNALRAGQSFQTAMKNVAEEMEEPVSREFMRVYRETQFGMPLETSLTRLVKRTGNPDLDLMCSAVVIQRQIGGNLAVILENISGTINQRIQLRGEVKTITSAGRLSGYIIGALPILIIVLLMFVNPSYVDMFFTTRSGRIMLLVSAVLEIIGFTIVRKIVNIKM